ncbi:hypothetical protein VTN02DRAFT_4665 [Thermoascus thermophilus]
MMDVFYVYTYSTAAWLAIQGIPLIASPQMIVTMLLDETRPASAIETYFARSFGVSLLTLAVMTVLLTGSIPLTATVTEAVSTTTTDKKDNDDNDARAPYAVPTIAVTAVFHALGSFHAYTRYTTGGQAAFALGMFLSGAVGFVGLWCILFGSGRGRVSRSTGADKRTAGFPFQNREAEKRFVGKGM